jgi:hypothetical protein
VFEVGVEDLRGKTRGSARTAFARQVAMYLAHVGCGVSLTEVGHLFDREAILFCRRRDGLGFAASRLRAIRFASSIS